jgi:hypothetical protein
VACPDVFNCAKSVIAATGLDCHFALQNVLLPPVFELVAATAHWAVAFRY